MMHEAIWDTSATLERYCERSLREAAAIRDALKRETAARTTVNTLVPYNEMLLLVENGLGWAGLMFQVHPNAATRKAAGDCRQKLAAFINEVTLDPELYQAVGAVETSHADALTQRFTARLLRDFRRGGVDQNEADRERLRSIHADIVKHGQTYQEQVLDDVRTLEIEDARVLDGLPQDWIDAHAPEDDGVIRISTDYPDFIPVQTYCHDEGVRRRLYEAFTARGFPANGATLKRLLQLRHEYATLLGYASWAEYNAETKMVRKPERIDAFIRELEAIARPRAKEDLRELLEFKRHDEPAADRVNVWDRFYYRGKAKSQKYGYDTREVRKYFRCDRVTAGLLALFETLFGVTFEEHTTAPVWHPAVRYYRVAVNGEPIAGFFLDLHPRDGKYKHAAMFSIHTGVENGQLPLAALVTNFPEPAEGEPALMEHTQVITFCHEFGHLMHHLLARQGPWANLSGINVEWDFVEVPSQLLEEWGWNPEVLQSFAHHTDTDEPIPGELVAKMRASEEFGKGAQIMRQLFYSAYSFYVHERSPEHLDLEAFTDEMYDSYSPYPRLEGGRVYANFGHLVGYSSAYYTYQWSLVIAKDVFTRFVADGMMNLDTAGEYVRKILVPGGTRDAAELVESFLGRPYNLDAYRAWLSS